ncbi:hypothetical protein J3F84DRAFT_372565 [Trichoderma pleuroticola]
MDKSRYGVPKGYRPWHQHGQICTGSVLGTSWPAHPDTCRSTRSLPLRCTCRYLGTSAIYPLWEHGTTPQPQPELIAKSTSSPSNGFYSTVALHPIDYRPPIRKRLWQVHPDGGLQGQVAKQGCRGWPGLYLYKGCWGGDFTISFQRGRRERENRAASPAARDVEKPIRLNKLGLQTGTEVRTDKWTDSMGIWTLSVWLAARLTPLPQSRQ